MDRRTKTIKNWKELIEFIDNEDPYATSVVLTGFIKKVSKGTMKTHKLIFTSVPVEELEDLMKDGKNCTSTQGKGEKSSEEGCDQYLEHLSSLNN